MECDMAQPSQSNIFEATLKATGNFEKAVKVVLKQHAAGKLKSSDAQEWLSEHKKSVVKDKKIIEEALIHLSPKK